MRTEIDAQQQCGSDLKEIAISIIKELASDGHTDLISVDSDNADDISIYWKKYHFSCDVYHEDGSIVVRTNIRDQDATGRWRSSITVLDASDDIRSTIQKTVAILQGGFAKTHI